MTNKVSMGFALAVLAWMVVGHSASGQEHSERVGIACLKDEAREALRNTLVEAGHEVVDLSEVWSAFGEFSALQLGGLDVAQRPSGWPAELKEVWDRGIAACKAQAGKPPYGAKNTNAFLCGRELSGALWQRYLDHVSPDLVLVVSILSDDLEGRTFAVKPTLFHHKDTWTRYFEVSRVPVAEVPRKLAALARDLLRGKGQKGNRSLSRDLPDTPRVDSPELFMGEVLNLLSLPLPKGCDGPLPAALVITPENAPLGRTIAALWSKSVPARLVTAKELRCDLRLVVGKRPIMPGSRMVSIEGALLCREERYAQRIPGFPNRIPSVHSLLAKKLVEKILKHHCQ